VPTLGKGVKKGFGLLDELANFDSPSNVLWTSGNNYGVAAELAK